MKELVKIRRILKTLSDDTRLRIINVLHNKTLNVAQLCEVLQSTQTSISKHLARLRLTGLVYDKREGQYVYYLPAELNNDFQHDLIGCVIKELAKTETVKKDMNRMKKVFKSMSLSIFSRTGFTPILILLSQNEISLHS